MTLEVKRSTQFHINELVLVTKGGNIDISKIYEEIKNTKTRKDLHKNGMYTAASKFGIYYDIIKYIPNSYSKYIILDTHTGIYYHSIQEAYNSSGYKISVGRFGILVKKNQIRYQIV